MSEIEKLSPCIASALRRASMDPGPLLAEIRAEHDRLSPAWAFIDTSGNRMDRRLPAAGVFLALVNVLRRRGEPFEAIRAVALDAARELVTPRGPVAGLAKRAVGRLASTRLASRLFERAVAAAPVHERGFGLRVVDARAEGFDLGFDVVQCGITRLFRDAGAEEYTKILCEIDFLTTRIAGLDLHRTGTLANGAPACDFRFRRERS